jgi:hypothetical protein
MDEHQRGRKGGRARLPNGMPIPSMASIIDSLSPGQFPLKPPEMENCVAR